MGAGLDEASCEGNDDRVRLTQHNLVVGWSVGYAGCR